MLILGKYLMKLARKQNNKELMQFKLFLFNALINKFKFFMLLLLIKLIMHRKSKKIMNTILLIILLIFKKIYQLFVKLMFKINKDHSNLWYLHYLS